MPVTEKDSSLSLDNARFANAKDSSSTDQARSSIPTRTYGTGRRKNAVARVWVGVGSGRITVNKKPIDQYFARDAYIRSVLKPLELTGNPGSYDVFCTVKGGGTTGQAGALLHGLARALDALVPDIHSKLRANGFLTRDPRVVERKKYGQHKARKSTQFSKR
jgi:small subunit ribosomal protein S9